MPFVFDNRSILDKIKKIDKSRKLALASADCLLDYVNDKFTFVTGETCEDNSNIEAIGAGITKRGIREMIRRFKVKYEGNSEMRFSVDYGSKILKSILTKETKGIRFYFGLRSLENGEDFISLILVGLDSTENEMVKADVQENEVAGDEVGHGHKFAEIPLNDSTARKNKFTLANF